MGKTEAGHVHRGHVHRVLDPAFVALALGGTALFLGGHAFFKWAVLGTGSYVRVVAVFAHAALIPVGCAVPALVLAAALIVAGVAAWDTLTHPVRAFAVAVHHMRTVLAAVEREWGDGPRRGMGRPHRGVEQRSGGRLAVKVTRSSVTNVTAMLSGRVKGGAPWPS